MGIATTRHEQRAAAMLGLLNEAPVRFEPNEAVDNAGVLFLLPALLAQGLLQTKEIYQYPQASYYSHESIILTLALMALMRIKNPEQLKNCKPGEIGRIIGLDRIPETKCLRGKIDVFSQQEKSWELNKQLIDQWYKQDEQDEQYELFFYIDGHVRIYYGDTANLPAKYVSRQKLCLSATTEFWVNDEEGLPVMVIIGELTEKLQTIIEYTIIPKLIEAGSIKNIDQDNPPQTPQCTLVFDREAYHPAFFIRLWKQYRIAIITYRKFVKDKWEGIVFKSHEVQVLQSKTTMLLCEQETSIENHVFREIRRLGSNDHQTSILTTHPFLAMEIIAGKMFGRWIQENFFRYLIADYDFDKLIQYEVKAIDENKEVVNPQHRRLSHALKKLREKISRQKAYFYPLAEKAMDKTLDNIEGLYKQQADHAEQLKLLQQQEQELVIQLKDVPNRIKLSQMPLESRYNKLHTESKLFMNIIKMICYRAETTFANLLQEYLARVTDEKRMLVKQIINTAADLLPDYENKKLVIVLHSLSAPRFNAAVEKIIPLLNDTQTVFPGTDLVLVFKTTST
jgi:hypothetical protein